MTRRHRGTSCSEIGFDGLQRSQGPPAVSNMVGLRPPACDIFIAAMKIGSKTTSAAMKTKMVAWNLVPSLWCEEFRGPNPTTSHQCCGSVRTPSPPHPHTMGLMMSHRELLHYDVPPIIVPLVNELDRICLLPLNLLLPSAHALARAG